MNQKTTLLSTKKLTPSQENMILGAGLSLVSYDAIAINFLDFQVEDNIPNSIFTSQNAVHAVLNHKLTSNSNIGNCFCVGEKTASLLIKNGRNVLEKAENASELGKIIVRKYKNKSFVFYTGTNRRDELPNLLRQFNIPFKETVTYNTTLNPQVFQQSFDGVLLFSPSGVTSYFQRNILRNGVAFCIGATTAAEAKKHTNTIEIATHNTIEKVIQKALDYFNPTV